MRTPVCCAREGAALSVVAQSCPARWRRSILLRGAAARPRHFPTRTPSLGPGRLAAVLPVTQWESRPLPCLCSIPRAEGLDGGSSTDEAYVVVNFYRFVHLENPEAEVSKHHVFLQGRDVHGRIYINEQGINAQFSGPYEDALAYAKWLKEDVRFSSMLVQISPTLGGHAFPRLKLRYKPSLVQLEGGVSHLPLVNPAMRATPLSPSEWRQRLQDISKLPESLMTEDRLNLSRKILLLDVRNGYEWDIGHFKGAQRPDVDCFRSTAFGQKELCDSDPLAGIDKEKTDIMMYCTGGIRCDVYSTILRQRGFHNLFTLSGGVSHYLKSEGPAEWVGNLFVFDSRLSLPPSAYKSEKGSEEVEVLHESRTFASCYICQSYVSELRHRNCANIDCNLLFLCCQNCVEKLCGCCRPECKCAPRLRPALPGSQRYQKWHIYRDAEMRRNSFT